jgi:enoyl-CoA hydratase/carnithine racemase
MFETLHLTVDGAVATLRFEHGKANEIGSAQLRELERLAAWLGEGDVRALVTWSDRRSRRGTPIFVSGADVTERVGWSTQQVKDHVRYQRSVLAALRAAPVFHVAVVAGVAFGWGTEYLLTADYRIAAQGAVFALPETGLGILPGAGGTAELQAQIGLPQAMRLGMTGESIDGVEAARIGLVQEFVEDHEGALERAKALAARAATRSPTANAAFKRAALAAGGRSGAARVELEALAYEHCVETGEAAIGRENFAAARKGEAVPWGPRQLWAPDEA